MRIPERPLLLSHLQPYVSEIAPQKVTGEIPPVIARQSEGGSLTANTGVRWHSQSMPLPVVLMPFPSHQPANTEDKELAFHHFLRQALSQALREWELASVDGVTSTPPVTFKLLPFANPDLVAEKGILITFSSQTTLGRDYEVGHTQREVDTQGWIHRVTITLMDNPEIDKHLDSKKAQQQRWKTTLLHEIGHALGLEHGSAEKAVMHHRGWKNQALHPEDIAAIRQLYPPTAGNTLI
ncbi:MAG: matrixin family metalloprotease [Cyanobacteria bacterium]|nr:matrixin family metalloprotease [Cyanobacteriota bacterium]